MVTDFPKLCLNCKSVEIKNGVQKEDDGTFCEICEAYNQLQLLVVELNKNEMREMRSESYEVSN